MKRVCSKRTVASSLVEWNSLGPIAYQLKAPLTQVKAIVAELQAEGPGRIEVRHDGGVRFQATEYRWIP